jgi:predicted NAD/FAD-dependent oxidoreductase
MEKSVLIVGAGMAGLTAAGALHRAGFASVLLDKGRRVGGRMATRTIAEARFDHGAQHFGIRSDQFTLLTRPWSEAGIIREWYRTGGLEPRYVGAGGMRRIPEHLAENLDVRTETTVKRIEFLDRTVVAVDRNGGRVEASAIIITPPLPQTLALLDASLIPIADGLRESLEAIEYHSCLTVMLQLDGPGGLPDGHRSNVDVSIAWMADNAHKGTSRLPAVTVHSTARFAAGHLEAPTDEWTALLVAAARPHLQGRIVGSTGHRWRYAEPTTTLDQGCLLLDTPVPLVLAGEVFAGAKIEGAALSGLAAATAVAEQLP